MDVYSLEKKIKILNLSLESENASAPFLDSSSHCYNYLKDIQVGDKNAEKLQLERLQVALQHLQQERNDVCFARKCLFCNTHFFGNRSPYFTHLTEQHHFFAGDPDNIVFSHELLNILEEMLRNLQCFYCEKIFKDWATLKEHMRKKQHKQINPKNKTFDRFYIVNYLELGRTWTDIKEDSDTNFSDDADDTEMEIVDSQDKSMLYVCLYCEEKFCDFDETLQHMKVDHQFDFKHLKEENHLDFYAQVKLINFIRRKIFERKCTVCDMGFALPDDLLSHMTESGHIATIPDPCRWNQALYYFPTFENDNLLCALDEMEDSNSQVEPLVYPEEAPALKLTVLRDENLRKTL